MKKLWLCLPVILFLIMAFSGCKKTDNPGNNNNANDPVVTQFGGEPVIPSGAAGVFYAINNIMISNPVNGTDTVGSACAWFGNQTSSVDAGALTCNGVSLSIQNQSSGSSFNWYQSDSSVNSNGFVHFKSNPVQWSANGNSANNIPAINYTDSTPFPYVRDYAIEKLVSTDSALVVYFSVQGSYDKVYMSISGSLGRINEDVTGLTKNSYAPGQLQQVVAQSGDMLTVEVMPIKTSSKAIGGQTWYFVKQSAYDVYATTRNK